MFSLSRPDLNRCCGFGGPCLAADQETSSVPGALNVVWTPRQQDN